LQNSPTSNVFNAPPRGSPWIFVTVLGLKKPRMTSLPDRQKNLREYVHSFRYNTNTGQTEGEMDRLAITSCSTCTACWHAITNQQSILLN